MTPPGAGISEADTPFRPCREGNKGSTTLDRNLAALAQFQPDLARCLSDLVVSDQVRETTGRDGSRTFRLRRKDAAGSVWFGQSSMPTISATELFAGFQSDAQSVCLPGVLTGLEPIVVAAKVPDYCAVFVVEREPLHVKLALCLHDYESLIRQGRVVFLVADRLQDALVGFFETHPGYCLPTRLLPVPQCGAAQLAELQRRLEQAAESIRAVQLEAVASCKDRLANRTPETLPDLPHLAIVGHDARPETIVEAKRLERAARHLGWMVERCVPDSPQACHVAGRLNAVERVSANLVLFVNCVDGQVASRLPRGLPTASWLLGPLASGAVTEGVGPDHLYFVPSRSVRGALVAQGVDEGRIELCGPAAGLPVQAPTAQEDQTISPPSCDVALLTDLPDDRPESCGITLTSHVKLWQEIQNYLSTRVDQYEPSKAAFVLGQAERAIGISLEDAAGRQRFIDFIRFVIAPACRGRTMARALTDHGFRLGVWGQHWSTSNLPAKARRGPIPTDETLIQVFRNAKVVVLPAANALVIRAALDVLAAGTDVLCLAGEEEFLQEFPTLKGIASYLRFYRTSRELVETVAELTNSAKSPRRDRQDDRATAAAEHTLDKRLLALAERVRRRIQGVAV